MKWAIVIMFLCAISASAQAVLSPAAPVFNQGQSGTITATGSVGTGSAWTCPGCAGTLSGATATTVLYTAPATVTASQSWGGFQLLPNNHIYNTRIDSLAVHASSTAWINATATVPFNITNEPSWQLNYVDGSTPLVNEIFQYTSGNNGNFQMPAYPGIKIEGAWFTKENLNIDHHLFAVDKTNGIMQELYDPVTPPNAGTCPTCTAVSGIRYQNSTYGLPNTQGGSVDAAGMYIAPLSLRVQEMEQAVTLGIPIKHALRVTINQFAIASSFLWPATAFATNGGTIPFGARLRLKSSFVITGYSATAQIVLTALKNYGMFVADGGTAWAVQIENSKWPAPIWTALQSINGISKTNFEVVDESGLMVSSTSGVPTTGRELVTYTSSTGTATVDVALVGVTVNFANDIQYIQAATPAQQLSYFVHGGATNTVTCTMSPTVGAITSGCLYTPPASVSSSGSSTVVTATSVDTGTVAAQMTIWVLPTGSIYLRPGASANFTDSLTHVWLPIGGDNASWIGCCGDLSGSAWTGGTDLARYWYEDVVLGDLRFDLSVPNGTYNVTFLLGTPQGVGGTIDNLEAQGTVGFSNLDINTAAGGSLKPVNKVMNNVTVTNGLLSAVVRGANPPGNPDGAIINAIQIDAVSVGTPGSPKGWLP